METIKPIVDEVLVDLGIEGKQVHVETATGVPNSESVRIRLFDASGDAKSVVVDLRGRDGRPLGEDDTRQRIKEHLATFKETPLH